MLISRYKYRTQLAKFSLWHFTWVHQGSKNLLSNTCQCGSKRKVLVAKLAVKLKFQSPNWQMQRNALLVWGVFEVVIVWLIGLSNHTYGAASYLRVGVEHYWLFGTFLFFAAGAFSPSSFELSSSNSSFSSSSFSGRSRRTLVSADALGHLLLSNPTRIKKKSHVDDWNAWYSSAPLSSDGLQRRSSGKAPRFRKWLMLIDLYRTS